MIFMHVDEKSISFEVPNKLIHMGMLNKLVNDKIPSRAAQKSRHAPELTRRDPRGFFSRAKRRSGQAQREAPGSETENTSK